jgi:serine phosphatase RsbU (regulator of sigma subunit)
MLATGGANGEYGAMSAARASRLHFSTVLVLLVGFGLTAVLSLSARAVHNNNEDRLLRERVQEAGVLFTGVLPSRVSPLAAAAAVAEATNGDRVALTRVLGPSVGTASGQYASASIWSTGATAPVLVLGARPELEDQSPAEIRAVLGKAARTNELSVVSFVDDAQPRIGYAFASQHAPSRYVAYTEANLPKDRQSRVIKGNDAFAGLDYAVYIGSTAQRDNLLTASASNLPLRGRTSSLTVPFGDSKLLIVMSPTAELGGTLLAKLQWLVLGFGVLFTLGAAALSERLVRRREQAVELAEELRTSSEENARLYAAQRSVAQTLQHSLLPEILPEIPGLTVGARYIAGTADIEIGGDWYDVMHLDDGSVMFVVGDVSGRGLAAGTIMAGLRYAIRAYAAQGDDPATILTKLAHLISIGDDGHFATVLCGVIDVDRHVVTLANAAHPAPLLINGQTRFVSTSVGVPIGVKAVRPYDAVTITVPEAATLLVFTDGLVERRGEIIDAGLERLRETADQVHTSLEDLLEDLTASLPPDGPADDTAILGVRWTN